MDHEVDFVVAIGGAGVVCLEVEGGEVWHDGNGWCQIRGGKHVHIEPVRQSPWLDRSHLYLEWGMRHGGFFFAYLRIEFQRSVVALWPMKTLPTR